MALITCKDCQAEISPSAEKCPKCGAMTEHAKLLEEKKSVSRTGTVAIVVGVASTIVLGPAGLIPFLAGVGTKLCGDSIVEWSRKKRKENEKE